MKLGRYSLSHFYPVVSEFYDKLLRPAMFFGEYLWHLIGRFDRAFTIWNSENIDEPRNLDYANLKLPSRDREIPRSAHVRPNLIWKK